MFKRLVFQGGFMNLERIARCESILNSLDRLTREDIMLLTLREELYGGSWDRFKRSIKSRLKQKPIGLVSRLKRDLSRVERLVILESKYRTNLGIYFPEVMSVRERSYYR